MLHETHTGPLRVLNFTPRGRYYGSITTSAFYPLVVAELWHWTGEKARVAPFIDPALKALTRLDEHSDLTGDGFYDYQTRLRQGVVHQAWRDSRGAIVQDDGSTTRRANNENVSTTPSGTSKTTRSPWVSTATLRFRRKRSGASTCAVLRKRGPLHVVRQPSPWSLTAAFAERVRGMLAGLLPGN
ncbi:MAG: hypothetical protein ACOC95_03150 [Planctomycetota bacterium]